MKANKISILIFSVVAGLILLCIVFPREGIDLGFTELRFPDLMTALRGDTTTAVDPEEQLRKLEEEQAQIKFAKGDSTFLEKINKSASKILFAGDDVTYFDPVFAALDSAQTNHMRIIHYGDSQIELDRISCDLREMLQDKFGGHGRGWIPVVPIAGSTTVNASCSPYLNQGLMYSFGGDTKARNGNCGPYATVAYLDGGSVTVSMQASDRTECAHVRGFDRVKVLTGNNGGAMSLSCSGVQKQAAPTQGINVTTFAVDSTSRASVTISGRGYLYGVLMDSETGVSVDNVPMRGCTGTIFPNLEKQALREYFATEYVPLIILQYGGNVVPYINQRKCPAVVASLRASIDFFKEVAPKSRILFIGPSDMSTSKSGSLRTYPNLPMYIDALKEMCADAGVAYWDVYAVMGGENSMVSWVKQGLAGSDYIHFSTKGAKKVAGIFNNSFMLYYDYYHFRKDAGKIK